MAIFINILSVGTDGAGGRLTVRGEAVDENGDRMDLGDEAQIVVAAIQVGNLSNRADPKLEEPVTNPWVATTGSHHFNQDDEVHVVVAVMQNTGDRPRLFADGFTVGDFPGAFEQTAHR